ncbi:MAG: antitoxin VbhA family protein [Lachnospiraceae bacterium]|nr:antitoxin VbhA family protein [Lachnospiraceae bacterium]
MENMVDEELCRNLDSAILSNEIEGSYCTEEEKDLYNRVKKGELTLEEATNKIVANIMQS